MIEVQQVTKEYGPRRAVDEVSFNVSKGEIVGFLGPNGAGKSTTMKIITGFMPATEGSAKVDGYDVFEDPMEVKKRIGFLPENPPVYLEMQVEEYVRFAAKLHGVPSQKVNSAASEAIGRTALGDVSKRLIGNLSKGYRQRVGLAQAIVHNPSVLILDEPTVGLDPRQIIEIRDLIKSIGKDHTVILSTHILPEVTQTCDRIIIISKGKVVASDRLEDLVAQTKYTLSVKNPSKNGIDAISGIPGVKGVTNTGDKLILDIDPKANDSREDIVKTAVSNEMGVLEFSTGRASLEEIFLELTSQ